MAYAHLHNVLNEVQPLNIVNLCVKQGFFLAKFQPKKMILNFLQSMFHGKNGPNFAISQRFL
jgi:hypothetical protein